jgi:hypothetical protein
MEQRPFWEANILFASQDIPRMVSNPKVHYRIHNSLPPLLILSQIDPVHAATHFSKTHFNIIRPSTPASFKSSPSLRFPH